MGGDNYWILLLLLLLLLFYRFAINGAEKHDVAWRAGVRLARHTARSFIYSHWTRFESPEVDDMRCFQITVPQRWI